MTNGKTEAGLLRNLDCRMISTTDDTDGHGWMDSDSEKNIRGIRDIRGQSSARICGEVFKSPELCIPASMRTAPSPLRHSSFTRRSGFTLLEVILSVIILASIALGIFKFVQSNLRAIQSSVQDTEEQLAVERLASLVQEELSNIVPKSQSSLLGEGLKLGGTNLDSIEWRSRGGPGLMTTAVSGEYRVKLRMQPLKDNQSKYEIGLWRRPALLDTESGLIAGGSDKDATWVPLLQNVTGLTIRYWDARMGQLLDSWRDQAARPSFVVLSILREGEESPYEAVLGVPAAMTQQ